MSAARQRRISLGGGGRDARPALADATPERLAHARRTGGASIEGEGVRRLADPFDLLRTRQVLDRQDANRNDRLWQAGERFRRHWHLGRMDGLAAFDFTRDSVDGTGGAAATAPTEAALRHRDAFRRAREAVGARLLPYLDGIVVEGGTVASLRRLVTDTGHERTAETLVVERLREALDRLCDLWGMQPVARRHPITGWREP